MNRRYVVEINTRVGAFESFGESLSGWIRETIQDGLLLDEGVQVTEIEPFEMSEHDRARLGYVLDAGDWFTGRLLRLIASSDRDNRARIAVA